MTHGSDGPPPDERFAAARKKMVRDHLVSRGISDRATLAAMSQVPRELFVPPAQRDRAYRDGALSIGRGQTISQPYMVALMTAALGLTSLGWPWKHGRPVLLDVGTGSGYQAAVLAETGAHVISIERDPELAFEARARLESLGYDVEVHVGDGSLGYPSEAPYRGIIVGAGAPEVPAPLVAQLADGACLVVPVGPRSTQRLTVVRRRGETTEVRQADACVFVPLVGSHGHPG